MDKKNVVLGLSGGVDSSAAAHILMDMGYEVHGVFLMQKGSDPAPAEVAARELGISFEVIDMSDELERNVICPFVESYLRGETPNPCIICNPTVKFRCLREAADRVGAYHIATGHYAVAKEGGIYASPSPKDQSYMLYRLPHELTERLIFPLGDIADKSETRAIASDAGLSSGSAPDSMDICFIPDGDHGAFIEKRGLSGKRGNFVDEDGHIYGPHEGIHRYTVGQRRGLGVAASGRLYVKNIDPESGDIVLSLIDPKDTKVYLRDVVFTDPACRGMESIPCKVKVRHTKRFDSGVFYPALNMIEFEQPVRALSPGQSAVCYSAEGRVLCGGFIRKR